MAIIHKNVAGSCGESTKKKIAFPENSFLKNREFMTE
jgi:hypothetical protein